MAEPKIWMNGKLVTQAEAVLPVNSAAVFYATNVFEGLRAYWNETDDELYCFRLDEHFARFRESMKMMRFTVPYSDDDLLRRRPRDAHRQRASARTSTCTSWPTWPVPGSTPPRPTGLYINPRRRGRIAEDSGLALLHQLVGAHLRQRDPDPPQVRRELPERPPRHAAGEGRRLRRADLPEPAGPRRRGHGRDVLHGAQGPASSRRR